MPMSKEEQLIEDTLLYISESKYPEKCSANRKQQIRTKAKKIMLRDGELYYSSGGDKPVLLSTIETVIVQSCYHVTPRPVRFYPRHVLEYTQQCSKIFGKFTIMFSAIV